MVRQYFRLWLYLVLIILILIGGIAPQTITAATPKPQIITIAKKSRTKPKTKSTHRHIKETAPVVRDLYKAVLLADYASGQILFEQHAYEPVIPASMVKMMVLYLTMEQLHARNIHFEDIVTVSKNASLTGGQQVHLRTGERFTLEELIQAMIIVSANDAAVTVAEYLAGSTDACVAMMNAKAQVLGMKDTVFVNVNGLPPAKGQADNVTTAYDMAILARALLQKYPQILDWTSMPQLSFRRHTLTLKNTNRYLLGTVPGVDGLKTGYHAKAGFNVCVTAKRGDQRLLAVVMGSPSQNERNRTGKELLTMGFNDFQLVTVLKKGTPIDASVPVVQGQSAAATLVAASDAIVFVKKEDFTRVSHKIELTDPSLVAPISQGTPVGKAIVFVGDAPVLTVDLLVAEDIQKSTFLQRLKRRIFDQAS
jgi:serine-type D-Ala-D-Ala carboxypeptidase (penicillin-binding protein 5/6)